MKSNFTISTDKKALDINLIYNFLSNQSYWAKGRNLETVKRSIENSLCFGVYNQEHQQIAFARVVSDFAIYAFIMDVFVIEGYRGEGAGTFLMKNIMEYPELQGLKRWGLRTKDAHGLYAKFGFKAVDIPEYNMEKVL